MMPTITAHLVIMNVLMVKYQDSVLINYEIDIIFPCFFMVIITVLVTVRWKQICILCNSYTQFQLDFL